jgi:hypothetical protein
LEHVEKLHVANISEPCLYDVENQELSPLDHRVFSADRYVSTAQSYCSGLPSVLFLELVQHMGKRRKAEESIVSISLFAATPALSDKQSLGKMYNWCASYKFADPSGRAV